MLQQNIHFFSNFLFCLLLKILFCLTFTFLMNISGVQKEQNELRTHTYHSQDVNAFWVVKRLPALHGRGVIGLNGG